MTEPKVLTIQGNRQSGKTEFLASSIVYHLIDPQVKDDAKMLAASGSKAMNTHLFERVGVKLVESGADFSCLYGNRYQVGNKSVSFVAATPFNFTNHHVDYVFLDEIGYMDNEFVDFINSSVRPFSIVIQTQNLEIEGTM